MAIPLGGGFVEVHPKWNNLDQRAMDRHLSRLKAEVPMELEGRSVTSSVDKASRQLRSRPVKVQGDLETRPMLTAVDRASRQIEGDVQRSIEQGARDGGRRASASLERAGREGGRSFGDGFKVAAGAAVAAVGALVTTRGVDLLKSSVAQASDLGETVSKVGQVFGKAGASYVEAFASKGGQALGQSKLEVMAAASTFGIFGKAAGKSGEDLAKFSTSMAGLAVDLSSFHNKSPEQAVEALGAALRGESEPIRAFGVMLNDASLKAEALSMGIMKPVKDQAKIIASQARLTSAQQKYNEAVRKHGKDSVEALKAQGALGAAQTALNKATSGTIPTLTQQQKVLASQSLIMKQTKDAQGDFARTSDGLANQQRILSAQWTDMKGRLGDLLLPVVTRFVTLANTRLLPAIDRTALAFMRFYRSADVQSVLQSVGRGISSLGSRFMDAYRSLRDDGVLDTIREKFSGLGDRLSGVGRLIERVIPIITAGITELKFGITGEFSDISPDASGIERFAFAIGTELRLAWEKVQPIMRRGGEAINWIGENTWVLKAAIGALVAGLLIKKSVQTAAAASEALELPTKIALIAANFTLARSNRALAATKVQATSATVANTTAERVGLLTRLRSTAAMVAERTAKVATTVATRAMAAGQWLLNAALSANPIGLVIIGLVALGAGLVMAYRKSDIFRAIVNRAWSSIQSTAKGTWNFLRDRVLQPLGHWFGTTLPASFRSFSEKFGQTWRGIRSAAAQPVNFVIGTVYNNGLRKAMNLIPGVNLKEAPLIKMAEGGSVERGVAASSKRPILWGEVPGVEEYYIPINGSTRSRQLVMDAASKLGVTAMAKGGYVWPTTSRALSGNYSGHSGVDIPVPTGTPLFATSDAIVDYVGWGRGYGNAIFLRGSDGVPWVYGHGSRPQVSAGQQVRRGQQIGLSGNTGRSTGPHLHIEAARHAFAVASNRAYTLGLLSGSATPVGGAAGAADPNAKILDLLTRFPKEILSLRTKVSEGMNSPWGGVLRGGILQILGSAQSWGVNKLKGILGPAANVAKKAATNAIAAQPGVQLAKLVYDKLKGKKGYSTGTMGAVPGWAMIDENGDEWVNFRGGERVMPAGRSPVSGPFIIRSGTLRIIDWDKGLAELRGELIEEMDWRASR